VIISHSIHETLTASYDSHITLNYESSVVYGTSCSKAEQKFRSKDGETVWRNRNSLPGKQELTLAYASYSRTVKSHRGTCSDNFKVSIGDRHDSVKRCGNLSRSSVRSSFVHTMGNNQIYSKSKIGRENIIRSNFIRNRGDAPLVTSFDEISITGIICNKIMNRI